jgi:hypothetical protein
VPSQQIQGQLQTQHSVDTGNYIMEQYHIKSKTNYRQALEEGNTLIQKSKQTKMKIGNNNMITTNYVTQNITIHR